MTTNKTEVKRYSITTDKYYHPVPYDSDIGRWVEYSSYKDLQAERDALSAHVERLYEALEELVEQSGHPNISGWVDIERAIAALAKARGEA